ncbi:MAG: hypothetical protein APR63_10210 [Desulfuromonas sp. SDB]|nr:MAG: hypothetical protein APR63_10210 [Desulfuromonas sp. SDB]
MELYNKYRQLKALFEQMDGAIIAYSGGVDSTLVLKAGLDVIPRRIIPVMIFSDAQPLVQWQRASAVAHHLGTRLFCLHLDPLSLPQVQANNNRRCYFCKKLIFENLRKLAHLLNIRNILEGTNADDLRRYRPGKDCLIELNVRSPLVETNWSSPQIRKMLELLHIPNWNTPSQSCLITRIPYGQKPTAQRMWRVEQAEEYIRSLGIEVVRVRDHDQLARIEILRDDFNKFFHYQIYSEINTNLKKIGYSYVTVDLQPYHPW